MAPSPSLSRTVVATWNELRMFGLVLVLKLRRVGCCFRWWRRLKAHGPLAAGVRVSPWPSPTLPRCVSRRGALPPLLHSPPRRGHPLLRPDPPLGARLLVVMAQQLGPVASVLLKLPGMTALARRAAASYQAAVGNELRKYGALTTVKPRSL